MIHATILREIFIAGECMKTVHEGRRGFESVGDEEACCTSFFYENYRDQNINTQRVLAEIETNFIWVVSAPVTSNGYTPFN